MPNRDYPPLPELADVNSQPPDRSDYVELSRSDRRIVMWANSDNSGKNAYVCDLPNKQLPNTTAIIENYWDGYGGPADYKLSLREFWRPVGRSYHRIPPGNTITISVSKTEGISTTVSQSLTLSLGVSEGGVSADISATFSNSVTTSQATTTAEQVDIVPPAEGRIRVWLLWQLVQEIVAIRPDGSILPPGDPNHAVQKAQVAWDGPGHYSSGAWVNYMATDWLFPSDTYAAYQKDFATSAAAIPG